MIIEKITETDVQEVADLTETNRGANGFGSSGLTKDISLTSNNIFLSCPYPG
jgi:hypothetical protein